MKYLKPEKNNKTARMEFVKYWAEFVKNNPASVWSAQHNRLINSMMQNAKHNPLTPKQYLKIKGEQMSKNRA